MVRATLQHEAARRALTLISQAAKAGRKLSYQGLALALGRGAEHARAIAQVCDLLDSAATLAGRPHMALWTVRDSGGKINPKAWTSESLPGLRELLIKEAESHDFSDGDERAIRAALDTLTGMGNRRAWVYVHEFVSQQDMAARLEGREPPPTSDSLNDLGTDKPPLLIAAGQRYFRDPAVRAEVIKRAGGCCEFCERPGFLRADGRRYLECHHIIALSQNGKDRLNNVIALCPDHHREAHFGADSAKIEERMMTIVSRKQADRKR